MSDKNVGEAKNPPRDDPPTNGGSSRVPESVQALLGHVRDAHARSRCGQLEEFTNELIQRACERKHFEQTSGPCGGPAGEEHCQRVEVPRIEPCLRLRWGDGPKDQLETDDAETLCLTVCNPYSNVTFEDFTLYVVVVGPNGQAVPVLPDGTPSVAIKPDYGICFGDVQSCDPEDPRISCVSREVVLLTRGAKRGKYPVYVIYCFKACFEGLEVRQAFSLKLVES